MPVGGMAETVNGRVELPDMAPDIFELICEYVYTGQIMLTAENIVPLLVASRQYSLDDLLGACLAQVTLSVGS